MGCSTCEEMAKALEAKYGVQATDPPAKTDYKVPLAIGGIAALLLGIAYAASRKK